MTVMMEWKIPMKSMQFQLSSICQRRIGMQCKLSVVLLNVNEPYFNFHLFHYVEGVIQNRNIIIEFTDPLRESCAQVPMFSHMFLIKRHLMLFKPILYNFRESVNGLRTFLLEQTAKGGDRQVLQYVTDLLNKNVGFLFNERFINIPAQVRSWSR